MIVSEPGINPDRVMFVSVTSYDVTKEKACLLQVGDHPFIKRTSCISYGTVNDASLQDLLQLRDAGQLNPDVPVSAELLARIRLGASLSRDIKLKYLELMLDQGLLD